MWVIVFRFSLRVEEASWRYILNMYYKISDNLFTNVKGIDARQCKCEKQNNFFSDISYFIANRPAYTFSQVSIGDCS